jgi:multiple sugar transport system ATP-binding protein
MAEVLLEHLTKVYPSGVLAVRDLNLHVADGELVVLVGPSGCGKTTTLRLIAGLEDATAGSIAINGRIVNSLPPRERNVAMVFQRSTLYPHMNVRRNLWMGLQMARRIGPLARLAMRWFRPGRYAEHQDEQRLIAERVSQAAHLLGLEDVLDRLPAQLSGGQQQRVALGRAIVRRPSVFLLDEPLSHLDGRLRVELRHELHLLQRRLRATMVYVTHDQAEAMTLADRVAVMDRGVVQQLDRPLAVYEQPANRFVAGFMGWPPMNFADGHLLTKDGQLSFACDDWCLLLPSAKTVDWEAKTGQAVSLGIRPEDIYLRPPAGGGATLPMEVVLVESLGHSCLVTLRHGGWQCVALFNRSDGRDGWKRSDWKRLQQEPMVEVAFHLERAHLFDRSTGLAWNNSRPAG